MLQNKQDKNEFSFEHLFYNILSSLLLIGVLFAFDYVGIKGYILQSIILLMIAWGPGFFLYPIFMLWKPTALLFLRFMKDIPMLFPTMFFVVILQPLFFGQFNLVDGGIPLSEFNETFFYLTFTAVLLFASNCHYLFAYIFSTKSFQSFYLNLLNLNGARKSKEEIAAVFDPNKNKKYWIEIKNLTYFILCFQIFFVMLPLGILVFIFQEVIVIPILQQFFGTILFVSGALMSIGGLRWFISGFEAYITKKHKVKL
jgi:hypothetical protein